MSSLSRDASPTVEIVGQNKVEADQNPWTHINEFYCFVSKENNILTYSCRLCLPRITQIRAHISSHNSVKQHIKRVHPSFFNRFDEITKIGSNCGNLKNVSDQKSPMDSPTFALSKKFRRQSIFDYVASIDTPASQLEVDQRIVELFVYNMLPLHIVESDAFVKLIKSLNPKKSVISRRTLGRRILSYYSQIKDYLIKVLDRVEWVATTADCWSNQNKSYLSMTVHWLDPHNRQRKKALLACIRLKGGHTVDVIAQSVMNIHDNFCIDKKVATTTTDNGNNFLKAFNQFHFQSDANNNQQKTSYLTCVADDQSLASLLQEPEEDEDFTYICLADSFSAANFQNSLNVYGLPRHIRCAAHTFNLIASKDAEAALRNTTFERAYKSAFGKASAVWNLQSRSAAAADSIRDEIKRTLVVPNTIRWNSVYESVMALNVILETKRIALRRVMAHLKLDTFTDYDVTFLKEYVQVMSPVAKALDKIQGEDQAYLGTLLPTVAVTIMKLKNLKTAHLIYCNVLVDVLLKGIERRFMPLMENEECQLAAAFHPKFRLIWLHKFDNSKITAVKTNMTRKVYEAMIALTNEADISCSNNEEDFFTAVTESNQLKNNRKLIKDAAENLVETWLRSKSKEILSDAAFCDEKVLINLFIKYNTAIPSSAAVERLFLTAKDKLRAKRASLSDENFEMLLFLKGNMHLMREMQNT